MKKSFFFIALLSFVLLYIFKQSRENDGSEIVNTSELIENIVPEPEVINNSIEEGAEEVLAVSRALFDVNSCEELRSACLKCDLQMQDLIKEVDSIGEEAASRGPYSLMTVENLNSLAESGDKNAMYYYGIDLIWQGVLGIRYLNLSNPKGSNPEIRQEIINNHNLDIETLSLGKEFLFQAALHGRASGWLEMQSASSMLLNRMQQNKVNDKELYRDTIAEYIAVSDVAHEIYKKDKHYSDIYLKGINNNGISLVRQWKKHAAQDEVENEIDLIKRRASAYYDEFLKRWVAQRSFLGKEVYPVIFDESFDKYYKAHLELCLDKNN